MERYMSLMTALRQIWISGTMNDSRLYGRHRQTTVPQARVTTMSSQRSAGGIILGKRYRSSLISRTRLSGLLNLSVMVMMSLLLRSAGQYGGHEAMPSFAGGG